MRVDHVRRDEQFRNFRRSPVIVVAFSLDDSNGLKWRNIMTSVCKTNKPFHNSDNYPKRMHNWSRSQTFLAIFFLFCKTTNNVMVIIKDRVTQIYLNSILIPATYKPPFFSNSPLVTLCYTESWNTTAYLFCCCHLLSLSVRYFVFYFKWGFCVSLQLEHAYSF